MNLQNHAYSKLKICKYSNICYYSAGVELDCSTASRSRPRPNHIRSSWVQPLSHANTQHNQHTDAHFKPKACNCTNMQSRQIRICKCAKAQMCKYGGINMCKRMSHTKQICKCAKCAKHTNSKIYQYMHVDVCIQYAINMHVCQTTQTRKGVDMQST